MKTTIDLPDALYRRVKSKSSFDGQTVRTVTQRLYELWLEGRVSLEEDKALGEAGSREWAGKWVRETDELAGQIRKSTADKRTCRDILQADRR
jgi:hypothetical protein